MYKIYTFTSNKKKYIIMATEIQDDYLVCKEYHEQINQKSKDYPGFITFQHENKNHYFAWVNGDHIVLRSEAYPDAEKMERGIKAILKNCDLPERYSVDVEHGAHFLVLWGGGDHQKHSGNRNEHSEIGRSCPHKTREELNSLLQFKGKDFADKVVPLQGASASTTSNAGMAAAAATTVAAAAASATSNERAALGGNVGSTSTDAGGGMGWLKWLLPLLAIGAFLFWWKSCRTSDTETGSLPDTAANTEVVTENTSANGATTATDSTTTTSVANAPAATTIESIKVKLVDGTLLDANKGGVEDKLVTFLGDANAKFDPADKKANWYDFDNLNFDLGKSTITAGSMVQISNLAAILKAYPTLKIKVGGYTDKKGDDKANMTLSQSRADAVIAALKAKGANAAQLTGAEGYGETLATVVETESDEARRVDRRTAVRIMAK
jgi:outer membrane protein OmpA-like peptidoglycan-associated protein